MTERTREERLAALREARVVLVSACLLGEACRYDGKSKGSNPVVRALEGKEVVPVCPERWAGLGIPRPRSSGAAARARRLPAGRARAVRGARRGGPHQAFRCGAELALAAAGGSGRRWRCSRSAAPRAEARARRWTARCCGQTIVMAASTGGKRDQIADFSTPSDFVTVAIDGTDIEVAEATANGTSFSAPQVTALIAEMRRINPELTNDQVRDLLAQAATDTSATARGGGRRHPGMRTRRSRWRASRSSRTLPVMRAV